MAPRTPPASQPIAAPAASARAPERSTGSGGPLERVTVNLTPRSSRALDEVVQLTGDSKTDSINRAIQIYVYVERVLRSGGSIHVRETAGSEPGRLKIF